MLVINIGGTGDDRQEKWNYYNWAPTKYNKEQEDWNDVAMDRASLCVIGLEWIERVRASKAPWRIRKSGEYKVLDRIWWNYWYDGGIWGKIPGIYWFMQEEAGRWRKEAEVLILKPRLILPRIRLLALPTLCLGQAQIQALRSPAPWLTATNMWASEYQKLERNRNAQNKPREPFQCVKLITIDKVCLYVAI